MRKIELIDKALSTARDMTAWAKERFDLGDWDPEIKLDFEVENFRERSCGGVNCYHDGTEPTATFYLGVLQFSTITGFVEYPNFSSDKVIGSVVSDDWRVYVTTLVAHEFAHMVQYCLKTKPQGEFGKWKGGHGPYFQKIYGEFRKQFVNHLVPSENLGVKPEPSRILYFPHELLGTTYWSDKRGKLIVKEYRPTARIWKFVVQCPITETIYKTTEGRIKTAQAKWKSHSSSPSPT